MRRRGCADVPDFLEVRAIIDEVTSSATPKTVLYSKLNANRLIFMKNLRKGIKIKSATMKLKSQNINYSFLCHK